MLYSSYQNLVLQIIVGIMIYNDDANLTIFPDYHSFRVVGKSALAKEHCWVSSEDIFTGKFDTSLIPEVRFYTFNIHIDVNFIYLPALKYTKKLHCFLQCPDEWLLQFASGIKVKISCVIFQQLTKLVQANAKLVI